MGYLRYGTYNTSHINDLIGKTLTSVSVSDVEDEISFKTTDGESYLMYHDQDCCEYVTIEDIAGDLEDLVGSPILDAYETTSYDEEKLDDCESVTWTFYSISTIKGSVTLRWFGESNGYYSEDVDFVKLKEEIE
jgi:hypothetical protein